MNYVTIQLDKARNMKMGMKATSIIEEKFKKPIVKINFDELTIMELATIVYAGLVWEDKELTVDKVLDILDEHADLQTISETLAKAMEVGFARKNA
jgi:spore coat polysaccharide biosynthesis protein SpsF (cytidylyltransferase family)